MTIQHPIEDEVGQLARRVEKARGRLAYQFDPALTEALSEDELIEERELAEKIRGEDRAQRWKQVQAAAAAADRARQTTESIEKADIRDLLVARKAIAAQRRESSPHAKLASLYRHRGWSLRALAGVVAAGMLWSAVNVQHNIAPGGPSDPLYWFSYLIEAMISVCLIIIMIGTNKVAEWGVVDNRRQVAAAEIALLALTVTLNTYPYLRDLEWYDAGVHAVAPVMIGVALLIHDAASARYGLAIYRATEQVRDLPDPAEQVRRTLPSIASYRANTLTALAPPEAHAEDEVEVETAEVESVALEDDPDAAIEAEQAPPDDDDADAAAVPPQAENDDATPQSVEPVVAKPEKRRAPANSRTAVTAVKAAPVDNGMAQAEPRPVVKQKAPVAPVVAKNNPFAAAAEKPAAPAKAEKPVTPAPVVATKVERPAQKTGAPAKAVTRKSAPAPAERQVASAGVGKSAVARNASAQVTAINRQATAPDSRTVSTPAPAEPDTSHLQVVRTNDNIHDTGQFRIAEMLEQELAELQAERRRARASRQR